MIFGNIFCCFFILLWKGFLVLHHPPISTFVSHSSTNKHEFSKIFAEMFFSYFYVNFKRDIVLYSNEHTGIKVWCFPPSLEIIFFHDFFLLQKQLKILLLWYFFHSFYMTGWLVLLDSKIHYFFLSKQTISFVHIVFVMTLNCKVTIY